jgi:tetratricopeptide (TPR) repeat protein
VDEALADVNRSLTIQPNNSRAFGFRGTLYRATKDYSRALADFNEAVRRDEKNPEYYTAEAGIEEERGNFGKAAGLYSAALQFDPQSTALHLKRASALNSAGDQQGAFLECVRIIDLKPKEADGYACRGESLIRSGKYPAAVNDLNQAITLQPDSPQAIKLLPVVRELLEMNQAAVKLSTAADPPAPAIATPAVALPEPPRHSDEGSIPAPPPVPVAQSSPALSPTFPEPAPAGEKASDLIQTARKYLDQSMFALAIAKLDQAIALDPQSAASFNARGYAYLRSRAYASALNDFSKAIEIRPLYANAYWNRGVAKRLQGDEQGATEDARKARSLGWVVDSWRGDKSRPIGGVTTASAARN